jgi:FKBP-type peptidyl-prolyl cis-trans isomerase
VLKTDKEKASYAIGANVGGGLGKSLTRDGIEIDPAILSRGLIDGLAGGKLQLSDDEIKTVISGLQAQAKAHQAAEKAKADAEMQARGEENKKAGAAFLAENKTKEGVVTLPDGLQYKVVKQGDGPKPSATDTVECNYRGTLVDGKEFDSSAKHGDKPATFPVSGVIKGWTEILQLMPVGSKYQVFIPSELAYGERPSPDLGPNATLIFDVELVSIKAKSEAPAGHGMGGGMPGGMPAGHGQAAAPAAAPAPTPAAATPAPAAK